MGETRTRDGDRSDADARYPYTPAEMRTIAEQPRHRVILAVLSTHGPLVLHDLATHLVARRRGVTIADVTSDQRRRVQVDLHHVHLPELELAGLVERDDDRVSLRLEESARADALQRFDARPQADGQWEAVATILADDTRERVVAVLSETPGPVSLRDLAIRLATHEAGSCPMPSEDAIESVRLDLHHVHLPMLDDVGVVRYDPEARSAAPGRLPEPYLAVMHRSAGDASR